MNFQPFSFYNTKYFRFIFVLVVRKFSEIYCLIVLINEYQIFCFLSMLFIIELLLFEFFFLLLSFNLVDDFWPSQNSIEEYILIIHQ